MLEPQNAAAALHQWCQRRGIKTGVSEFLQYLQDRNALYLLPVIQKELKQMGKREQDNTSIQAHTGQSLSEKQKQALAQALQSSSEDTQEVIDPEQIAGADITYDNKQVQGSIAAQLSQLQNQLT